MFCVLGPGDLVAGAASVAMDHSVFYGHHRRERGGQALLRRTLAPPDKGNAPARG